MAIQWLPFVFGLIGGLVLGLVGRAIWLEIKRRGQQARFEVNPDTDEVTLRWVNTPTAKRPVEKINGKPAIPILRRKIRKLFQGRPAFFVDSITGEAFDPVPPKQANPWPTAFDRAKKYKSVRETRIANAADNNNAMDIMKIGAIAAIIAAAAGIIMVFMLMRAFGGV